MINKDRIQIDGEWYIKESIINPMETRELTAKDLTHYEGFVYETDDYCWEATRVFKDDNSLHDAVMVKFTDKTVHDFEPEIWDNSSWFLDLFEGGPESLLEAKASMNEEGIRIFREFIGVLIEENWL